MDLVYKDGERNFWCTKAQANTLEALSKMRHSGYGCWVRGYRPTTGYIVPPLLDIQIITVFQVGKVYERRRAALEKLEFTDVMLNAAIHPVLKHIEGGALFAAFLERKDRMIASLGMTLAGMREDNYRQGFDRNYIHVAKGVRVNVKGERVGDIKEPTLKDDLPIAENILVSYLEISRVVREEGRAKAPPNSGVPVLIQNIIESLLNARSVEIKTLSLKPDNFESLDLARDLMLTSDILALQ